MSNRWNEDDLERLKKRGFKIIETKNGKQIAVTQHQDRPELSEFSLDVPKKPKANKFNAKKVIIDGIKFDSTKEGNRYKELKLKETAGAILNLCLQAKFTFIHDGEKIGSYTADFTYNDPEGNYVVEDVKSPITRKKTDYRLRKKMMKAFFGIEILET